MTKQCDVQVESAIANILHIYMGGGLISRDGVSLRISSKHILKTSLPLSLYLSEAKREIEFFFLFPDNAERRPRVLDQFMSWGQLGVAMFGVRTIP